MTRDFAIIGCGGHGRVILDLLRTLGEHVIGFTDANPVLRGTEINGVPVLGDDSTLPGPENIYLALGLGTTRASHSRLRVAERLLQRGFRFPPLHHPAATLAYGVTQGNGSIVAAGAIVSTGVTLGAFAIINTAAVVDHDGHIGDFAHIAPGVTLSGNVTIGAGVHVGTGASIINGIQVGAGATIGAGSVVVRDVPAGATVFGVPARLHNK